MLTYSEVEWTPERLERYEQYKKGFSYWKGLKMIHVQPLTLEKFLYSEGYVPDDYEPTKELNHEETMKEFDDWLSKKTWD